MNTSNATGDFMKDGSVAMTGDFNGGTKNLTNIGTNIDAAAGLTITTASNNNLNLAPNGTGLVTTSSALRVAPTSLPLTPAAGTIAFDSSSANAMKYYDGSAWQTLGTGTGSGDFMKDGSVAMTGNLKLGANYISNDGGTSEGLPSMRQVMPTSAATSGSERRRRVIFWMCKVRAPRTARLRCSPLSQVRCRERRGCDRILY